MKWFSPSFSSRLTRRIILAVLITMAFITGIISLTSIMAMAGEAQNYYQSVMDLTEEKVEKVLKAVEMTAKNNIDEVEKGLANPSKVYAALENELKLNPHIIGFAAAFEPDYYPQQGKWFEPYVVQRDSDRIEIQQIGSADHDYFKSNWYSEALKSENGYWSDPYFDEAGAKMIVCSYMLPIHDKNGKTVGVFIADVSLDWLIGQVKKIDEKNNQNIEHILIDEDAEYKCYSFIIGKNGEYIVHPKEERILKENFITHTKNSIYKIDDELAEKMIKGERGNMGLKIDSVSSVVYYSPLECAGWSMAIVIPANTVFGPGVLLCIIILILMGIGLLAVFIICLYTIRRATKPLTYLSDSAKEVAKGNFETPLPIIKHDDEIHQLRDSFEEMQLSLSRYVEELKTTTSQKAMMESELNIARGIQMAMLPKTFSPITEKNDIDIFALLTPAKAVGGDFYKFYVRDERLYFCIGDVSGKGVPAALVMAVISTQFHTLCANESKPHKIVDSLNRLMVDSNPSMMFVTLFVGIIDFKTGDLKYCNAGHDAPILIDNKNYQYLPVDSNVPIGVVPDWSFSMQQVPIESGTTIFLYTDGLTEAEKKNHTLFGTQRIFDTIETSENNHPETIIDNMTKAIHAFVDDAEQSDDLTMLAIRYNQPK